MSPYDNHCLKESGVLFRSIRSRLGDKGYVDNNNNNITPSGSCT